MWSEIVPVGLAFLLVTADAFVVPSSLKSHGSFVVLNAAGKGFGEKKASSTASKKSTPSPPAAKVDTHPPPPPVVTSVPEPTNPYPSAEQQDLSMGKAALERLRRERAEKRDAELRKIKQVKDVDTMLQESPEAAVIPEQVAQRMGNRMLPFVGLPLLGVMGTFVGFWYVTTYKGMSFEPSVVATTTIVLLVAGLLGITYSLLSASWDPDREGSLLGTEEFSRNVDNIRDGLSRSRENAILRDRMNDISEADLVELENRDAAKRIRQQSFGEKIGEELE